MPLGGGKGALKLKGDDQIKKKKRKKKGKELALIDEPTTNAQVCWPSQASCYQVQDL